MSLRDDFRALREHPFLAGYSVRLVLIIAGLLGLVYGIMLARRLGLG